jgi:hypothetical protein
MCPPAIGTTSSWRTAGGFGGTSRLRALAEKNACGRDGTRLATASVDIARIKFPDLEIAGASGIDPETEHAVRGIDAVFIR